MRVCGECTSCCTVLSVDEIEKKAGNTCFFACDGCGIYNIQPKQCKEFSCEWLEGKFEEEDRPDKSGVIVTKTQQRALLGKRTLMAYEVEPGGFRRKLPLLERLTQKEPVLCIAGMTRKMVGPKDQLETMNHLLSKQRRQ